MFCGKCGAQNTENVKFCTNCGAKLNTSTSTKTTTMSLTSQDEKNRKVGIIVVVIVSLVVVIFGAFLFGGRNYKATVQKYLDATYDVNADELFKLIPDDMINYMLEEDGYDRRDLEDLIDEVNEELQDQLDSLDSYLGEEWEIDYEILYAGDIKGNDLDDIKNAYEDADVKVSAAKEVEVEITVVSKETESSNTLDISLIKVGRSWYLDVMSMGSLF